MKRKRKRSHELEWFNEWPNELRCELFGFLGENERKFLNQLRVFGNLWKKSNQCLDQIFRENHPNHVHPLSLGAPYRYQGVLAGWYLANYSHYVLDANRHSQSKRKAKEIYLKGDSAYSYNADKYTHIEVKPSVASILTESGVYESGPLSGIWSFKIASVSLRHCESSKFQVYSRLWSYVLPLKEKNYWPLINVFEEFNNTSRPLSETEKDLFQEFVERKEKKESRQVIVTKTQFLQNMNEQFQMDKWINCIDFPSFVLVGGSVLGCLMKEPFAKKKQDLDFFWCANESDYYHFFDAYHSRKSVV